MPHIVGFLAIAEGKLCSAAVSKGDLLQVLVAEDLYDRLGESADLLKRATYKAAKRWAGQEEVCRARMMSFLYDACPSARFFMQVAVHTCSSLPQAQAGAGQ